MLKIEDIEKLAKLARLSLQAEEKEQLRREVDAILGYVGEVQKISGADAEKRAGEVRNVFREDKNHHLPGEFSEDLLSEAPRRQDQYVKVKKIL